MSAKSLDLAPASSSSPLDKTPSWSTSPRRLTHSRGVKEMASSIFFQRGCAGSLRGLSIHARMCASNPTRFGNTVQTSRLGLLPALTTPTRAQTTQVFRCTSPAPPQISNPPTPSVLQFVSNKIWRATHRSRTPQRSSRSPFTPPPRPRGLWQQIKDRIDSLPSNGIFWGIMALNGIVFCLWQFARAKWVRTCLPTQISIGWS